MLIFIEAYTTYKVFLPFFITIFFLLVSTFTCKKIDIDLWHYRLGHPASKIVEQICKKLPYIQSIVKSICGVCHYAKQHKLPFK